MTSEWLGLILLGVAVGAQVTLRSFSVRYVKLLLRLSVAIFFGLAGYAVYLQYALWQASPPAKFLLPPYEDIGYFVGYAGTRFVAPLLIALLAAALGGAAAFWMNRRFGERFFEAEEPALFSLGIFLTGYPAFLLYMILMLLFGALLATSYQLLARGRAPLYWAWLPVAILAILLKIYVVPEYVIKFFNL
ncbi:MAG: hypothetical protein HY436_00545 [Candidatus Liptonbacteria bacterium]|nr:hypothetical protein [Candidatus Liptonbacteria bacterium]